MRRVRLGGTQSDRWLREGGSGRPAALEHSPGWRVRRPPAHRSLPLCWGSWRRARPSTFKPGLLSPFQADTQAWKDAATLGSYFLLPFPLSLLPPFPITPLLLPVALPSSQPTRPAVHWSALGKCSEHGNERVHQWMVGDAHLPPPALCYRHENHGGWTERLRSHVTMSWDCYDKLLLIQTRCIEQKCLLPHSGGQTSET